MVEIIFLDAANSDLGRKDKLPEALGQTVLASLPTEAVLQKEKGDSALI